MFAEADRLGDFLELTGPDILDGAYHFHGCNAIHIACLAGRKQALQGLLKFCDSSDLERRVERIDAGGIQNHLGPLNHIPPELQSDLYRILSVEERRKLKLLRKFQGVVGYAPLHIAAEKGDGEMCEILLSNGAEIDSRTSSGWMTPLYLTVMNDHTNVALALLKRDANYNLSCAQGNFAYDVALDKKNDCLIRKFLYLGDAEHRMSAEVVTTITEKLGLE